MAELGKMNRLRVVKTVDFGVYLDGDEDGEILLPKRDVPKNCQIGGHLDVFIYTDSEDEIIATTVKPKAMVGQCACLTVVDMTKIGAFMDWGLSKDLFVPFRQQARPMKVGQSYVVYLYVDENSDRIAASSRLDRFLSEAGTYFQLGQAVKLMISDQTDLGYKAVIDETHLGLLFKDHVFQPLKIGQQLEGFIQQVREDQKIDLSLQKIGHETRDELSAQILKQLAEQNGVLKITDKSPPKEIYQQFEVSKASYKKALGGLYKQRLIKIEKDKITLL